MPKLKTVINYLLLLFLFLLPWQTRWIYQPAMLNGGFWEYGTQSFYGTEILLWLIVILFLIDRFRHKEFWQKITNKDFFHSHRKRLVVVFLIFCFLAFLIWHSLSAEISYTFLLRLLGGFCLAAVILNATRPLPAPSPLRRRGESSPPLLGKGEAGERLRSPF